MCGRSNADRHSALPSALSSRPFALGRSERAIEPVQTQVAEPTRATERLAKVWGSCLRRRGRLCQTGRLRCERRERRARQRQLAFEAAAEAAAAAAAKVQALRREVEEPTAEVPRGSGHTRDAVVHSA